MKLFLLSSLLFLSSALAVAGPVGLATTNTEIYQVALGGGPSTLFATGLTSARNLTLGPDGSVYVADFGSGKVEKYSSSGAYQGAFISGLSGPYDLQWHGGDLYVSQWTAGVITRYNSSGSSLGTFIDNTHLGNAGDFFWGPDGKLYVSSTGTDAGKSHRIQRYLADGTFDQTFADLTGLNFYNPNTGQTIATPRDALFVGSYMYVADSAGATGAIGTGSGNIYRFDATTGAYVDTFVNNSGNTKGLFYSGSTLYASQTGNNGIQGYNPSPSTFDALNSVNYFVEAQSTPEPTTILLSAAGIAALALVRRKRVA
jgi:hypothetical protein